MKIITKDAVYVQKNDIGFLNQTDLSIPASIFMKVFGNGIVIINDSNRYEFIKFEEKHEIEYFKDIDFIVDYDAVKDLTDDKLIKLGQDIANRKNSIAKTFNVMSASERSKNMHMVSECEQLDFKLYSLRDILWFRQGHIKFDLPKEVCSLKSNKQKEKGLRRILKKK